MGPKDFGKSELKAVMYAVKREGRTSDAVIRRGGETVAILRGEGRTHFRLESTAGDDWVLDPRVHGEIRPFSMAVTTSGPANEAVLTIRNHVFFHNGKAYILTAVPADVHPAQHTLGKRHVSRLDKFPFTRLEDVDPQTWGRLRLHRGVSVGTIDGLGVDEFRVALSQELQDIGLPLSAASYLLYSTG